MTKTWLLAAGASGFLCVALGAFGAHGLKDMLGAYEKSIYETAVLYQMFHTLALLGVGILQHCLPKCNFNLAGWSLILGIVIFSGSLYLLAITGQKWLGAVTPIGGTAFLVGWGALIYTAAKSKVMP